MIYPSLHWRMDTSKKELFLTFDDGPVPGPTEFVLETLKQFNVRATFFCIGDNMRKHPYLVKQIIDDKHRIGNHTFHHLNGWKTDVQDYVSNINECDREIQSHMQVNTDRKLFRPPYGRITKNQIQQLDTYEIIMWDVLSIDYNKNLSRRTCFRNTLRATRAGSIIVFHDSVKAEKNLRYVLPQYIEKCLDDGYSFGPIVL